MALIMFSGMFGFGEMVSSISFMEDGEEAVDVDAWQCGRKCYIEEFQVFQ